MNELEKEILKDVVAQFKQNDSCLESKNKNVDVVPCAKIIDELTDYWNSLNKNSLKIV